MLCSVETILILIVLTMLPQNVLCYMPIGLFPPSFVIFGNSPVIIGTIFQ